jgi:hypothetical protein
MKAKRPYIIPAVVAVAAFTALVFAGLAWGLLSLAFWLAFFVCFVLPAALIYVYWRYKRQNELVQCNGCNRTMIYSVFQKSGGCPRCHADSYTRTGTWPKA